MCLKVQVIVLQIWEIKSSANFWDTRYILIDRGIYLLAEELEEAYTRNAVTEEDLSCKVEKFEWHIQIVNMGRAGGS